MFFSRARAISPFDPSRLNIAVHVRLGGRAKLAQKVVKLELDQLSQLIEVITQEVEDLGERPPLFHIHSETANPCPSLEGGTFPEFPGWSIAREEVNTRMLHDILHEDVCDFTCSIIMNKGGAPERGSFPRLRHIQRVPECQAGRQSERNVPESCHGTLEPTLRERSETPGRMPSFSEAAVVELRCFCPASMGRHRRSEQPRDHAAVPLQVQACHSASPPKDCPEKQAGGDFCYPHPTGIFHVAGEPLVMNVGGNVVHSLTSMISADGVVMGCSALGQLAGILSKGIKMFSVGCEGSMTWEQNKMSPPFAIAELGELWVPMEGSWAGSKMTSVGVFRKALQLYIAREKV